MTLPDGQARNAKPFVVDRVLATGTQSVTGETGWIRGFSWASAFTFALNVTDTDSTSSDTLDVKIHRRLPGGEEDDIVAFTQVVGNDGTYYEYVDLVADPSEAGTVSTPNASLAAGNAVNVPVGDAIKVSWTIVDDSTSAAFEFEVIVNARAF